MEFPEILFEYIWPNCGYAHVVSSGYYSLLRSYCPLIANILSNWTPGPQISKQWVAFILILSIPRCGYAHEVLSGYPM